jgi:hypothetical protein
VSYATHHRRLTGRPRLAAVAAATVWVAVSAAFSPVGATSYGPTVACEPPIATLQALISFGTYVDGPLSTRYGEATLNEGALACFGDTKLTVLAFRSSPEGQGGAYAYQVAPAWMDTWQQTRWFLSPTNAEIAPGFGAGPFLAVAVPPDLQDRFDGLAGQWVAVRGQFDDDAAATCRLNGDPKPRAGEIPTKADLLAMCRTSFVISGIDPVAAPCPTGTIDWAAIAATPEQMRADCFGHSQLSFEAFGVSLNNTWNLTVPEVKDWELLDPDGGTDIATERAKAVEAFVSLGLEVPNSSDAPWHDRDGVGGFDVRWRIDGHFDDPAAAACRPEPDGFILDGRTVNWSEDDARSFCRNHLFVDRLEWIREPGPSASSARAAPDVPSSTPDPSVAPGEPAQPLVATGGPGRAILAAAGVLALGLALAWALVRRRRA